MNDPFVMPPTDTQAPPWDLRPFELLRDGWALVKPHYLQLMLACVGLLLIDGMLMRSAVLGPPGLLLVNCTFNSGMCWCLVRLYQGHTPTFACLLEPMRKKSADIILLHLAAGALIGVGLILAVLPGLYLAVAFELSLPLLIFSDTKPWAALWKSRQLVHRQLGDFILLTLVLFVINVVAAMPMGLGLLISVPATAGACTLLMAQIFGLRRPGGFVDARLR